MYLSYQNIFCLLFLVSTLLQTILFQKLFKNTYPSFLATRLIIKAKSKEIQKNTSLIFNSNLLKDLLNNRDNINVIFFSLKSVFKRILFSFFLLSLKYSERFLLSLLPGKNCGSVNLKLRNFGACSVLSTASSVLKFC